MARHNILLTLALLACLLGARAAAEDNRRRHSDECRCSADCHSDEYCSDGMCELRKDDGDSCSGDEQCLSGTCHKSWVFGSSCATLCKDDDDCPSSRSICNTQPYAALSSLLGRRNPGPVADTPADADDDDAEDGNKGKGKGKHGGDGGEGGICVECMEDDDCGKNKYCQRGFHRDVNTCIDYGKTCAAYGDCPQGEYCDSTVDRCRPYYSAFSALTSRWAQV